MINFKSIAEGQFKNVETGFESESKGSFKMPESLAAGGKDAKKAPPAKDAKGKGGAVE